MKTLKARKNQNNEQLPIENGKRTFRLSIIFAITVIGLMVLRAIFANLVMSDNVSSWVFSFAMQVGVMGIVPLGLYCLAFPYRQGCHRSRVLHDICVPRED